jgi:hypothetical protein
MQARRDDARIVEYQEVTLAEVVTQIREFPVFEFCRICVARIRIDNKQAAHSPIDCRISRNQFIGQCVIEIGQSHCRAW